MLFEQKIKRQNRKKNKDNLTLADNTIRVLCNIKPSIQNRTKNEDSKIENVNDFSNSEISEKYTKQISDKMSSELKYDDRIEAEEILLLDEDIDIIRKNEQLEQIHIAAFNTIVKNKTNYKPQAARMWMDPINIVPARLDTDYIQILYTPGHYVCCYYDVVDIFIYDSLNNDKLTKELEICLNYIFPNHDLRMVKFPTVQQQPNLIDCGVYAIAFAVSLLFGIKPNKVKYDHNKMRTHLERIFQTSNIEHFPQDPQFGICQIAPLNLALARRYSAITKRIQSGRSKRKRNLEYKNDDRKFIKSNKKNLLLNCDVEFPSFNREVNKETKQSTVENRKTSNYMNFSLPSAKLLESNIKEAALEMVKDDKCVPARLVLNGFDEKNEEIVQMTIEEAFNYVISKVKSFMRDPNINPLLLSKTQISTLQEEIKIREEEFTKLSKMFNDLHREQLNFYRHFGVIPKVDSHSVGVSVDLPWLPETVPSIIQEDLMKKSSENRSMLSNSTGTNKNDSETTSKHAEKDSSGFFECIDLSDDDVTEVPVSTSIAASSVSMHSTSTASSTKPSTPIVSSTRYSTVFADLSKNTSITIAPVNPSQNNSSTSGVKINDFKHPAPLPLVPASIDASDVLPKPELSISSDENGIVLQWDYPPEIRAKIIMGYDLIGYQEKSSMSPSMTLWKKIGCVSPMPLTMSCTLAYFVKGYMYHFAIRALNKDWKPGHFSNPATIMFSSNAKKRTIA